MKSFIAAVVLITASMPTMASGVLSSRICTDLSVRLTVFSMVANIATTKEQYESFLYKKLMEGNAGKDEQKILSSLIDLAWSARGQDTIKLSMEFYDRCTAGETA